MNVNSVSNKINLSNNNFLQHDSSSSKVNNNTIQSNSTLDLNLSPSAFINKSAINFGAITRYNEGEIERTKHDLKRAIENKDYARILQYLRMNVREQDKNGMLIVANLFEPNNDFGITYKDIGINVNDLLSRIKAVDGNIYLPREKDLKTTGRIEKVRGNVNLGDNPNLRQALAQKYLYRIKTDLSEAIKQKDYQKILEYFNMEVLEKDENGLMVVRGDFKEPNIALGITYKTIGVDVNELLNQVKAIYGDLNLSGDKELKSTGAVESVYGDANFERCLNLRKIENLKYVHHYLDLLGTFLTSTGALECVNIAAYLPECLTKFPNIKCFHHVVNPTKEQDEIFRERQLTDWYQGTNGGTHSYIPKDERPHYRQRFDF